MEYNPDNYKEKEEPKVGEIIKAFIVDIHKGTIKDFVDKPEALKKFKRPEEIAIQVISEGKFDGRIYQCKTLFTYEEVNGRIEFDCRSNMAHFKKLYASLPKVGQEVQHVATDKGYFKLRTSI